MPSDGASLLSRQRPARRSQVSESPPPIPLLDLGRQRRHLNGAVEAGIARVLEHGSFIMGPEVFELEARLSAYAGAGHTVSCASGTDALVMALMAVGLRPGDGVLLPSFTFAATAGAVGLLGGVPVFVDIEPETFLLDVARLEGAQREAARRSITCRAVIAVDLFGAPCDYEALATWAQGRQLQVIADAAQSFGASAPSGRVGTLAPLTTTSFFPAKPLGCYGDGGAIFTNDERMAEILRSIRIHGKGRDKYDNVRIGLNGRLDTIQASVLLAKLDVFDEEIASRQRLAERYDRHLHPSVVRPSARAGFSSAWAQYTVRIPQRDRVASGLAAVGVSSAVYYPAPLHLQGAFKTFPRDPAGLAVSEQMASEVLSLPIHPYLTNREQDRVMTELNRLVA